MPGHADERINPQMPGVDAYMLQQFGDLAWPEIEGMPQFVDLFQRQSPSRDLTLDLVAGLVGRQLVVLGIDQPLVWVFAR
jgi:hypothetical protein